ncbi:MAG: tetratricopeptide repeat protein [Chitinophagales bacterium]|nr:tetratricopeptide repeat protein [Chitinophagales bacterium]
MNWKISLAFIFIIFLACKHDVKPIQAEEEQPASKELAVLDSLIKAQPHNADAYYDRALYFYNKDNTPKALADVYSALFIDSLKEDYYYLAGDVYLDLGEVQKAADLMSKAINLMPDNEEFYLRAIEYNLYLKNYQLALQFTNYLLEKNKYNADCLFFRGLVYKEMDDKAKAISNFQTCVEVDPQYYNAYMQMGLLYSRDKDDLALQYFKNALRVEPDSREAMYAIAYHYQAKKEYSAAIKEYKEMVKLNPKDHEAFFNIGHCYIELDSLDKAYKNFDIAVKVNPTYTGAYYMKGYVSELAGNKKDALFNYQ